MRLSLCCFALAATAWSARAFEYEEALVGRDLSGIAYCDRDDYDSRSYTGLTAGFIVDEVLFNVLTDVQGFVGYLPYRETIYVVIRGSESLRNWIANLDFEFRDLDSTCDDCQVHEGFSRAAYLVSDDAINSVASLKESYPGAKIVATGHSLGGAVAHLLALILRTYYDDVELYTFGSPRVVNEEFADVNNALLGDKSFRVVHNTDVVPHMPPEFFGYHHIATEYWEKEDGSIVTCNGSGEDPDCSASVRGRDQTISDHRVYLGVQMECPEDL
eukprot:CAMPEP_0198428638 /NCGR_PEP_ID=MMETSP1452-20131203/6683_1 /TAXON_ID=1181717 /ORGANISM="Synchroma pusillum, Strain CCMP3072" /LENGTH=272 /DNA_ID=CAMNT_0044149035 /DNA_START=75 /DNA_END=893 /DNA_ORIENTATION=+